MYCRFEPCLQLKRQREWQIKEAKKKLFSFAAGEQLKRVQVDLVALVRVPRNANKCCSIRMKAVNRGSIRNHAHPMGMNARS